ncbi:endo-1,4-beta-xylanase [Nocardiopsis algeriensis]|uniref:Beta-xylanase n=1 Tax=Nocardiopsis algeriensis TaxID=1478215 RepID=A0A841IPN6_9ACTN|nr:endo-1,4-beta-xylanase [Nocardiopsis algeriensis]MBB6118301.1 endo-1,4-beta-xylanase [Nocardiopsis algeriensis]
MAAGRRTVAARVAAFLAVASLALVTGAAGAAQAEETPLRDLADRHGLRMGVAVSSHLLDNARYADIAATQYNSVTHENSLKWESVQPQRGQFNWSGADRLVDFAQANGQDVYGHTLVWHSQLPSWVSNGGFSGPELEQVMEEHISTTVGRYRGDIDYWDVVNEAFNEDGSFRDSVFHRTLGEGYIATALEMAHEADPNARLFINDYNVEGINAKSDGLYRLASSLLAQGVPLHGVGLQSHLIVGQVPSSMQANIQRFADLGLEVVITEVDIRTSTPASQQALQQQANDYRTVFEACLAVDGCGGVTVWGVADPHSWIPDTFPGQGAALPYDDNYQPKPAYWAMHEALGGGQTDPGPDPDPDPDPEPGDGSCDVDYTVVNQWGQGAVVDVTVRNTGDAAVNGWRLTWTQPSGERITNAWNATVSQSGSSVTAEGVSWNGTLAPGASTSFGFQLTHTGQAGTPSGFSLNGAACG